MSELTVRCRGDRIYRFVPARTALLLIDLQQEFFVAGAGECLADMRAILPRVQRLLAMAREQGCSIIHTRESYQPDLSDVTAYRHSLGYVGRPGQLGRFCIAGEPGQAFVEQARPLPDETVIDTVAVSSPPLPSLIV